MENNLALCVININAIWMRTLKQREIIMRRSEVIKILLSAYIFQEGRRSDLNIIQKTGKIIKYFEKEESKR
jgi:hypothetical protein